MDLSRDQSLFLEVRPLIPAAPTPDDVEELVRVANDAFGTADWSGPAMHVRLSEGDRLIETPSGWDWLPTDGSAHPKALTGTASHSALHAFVPAAVNGPLPPLLAVTFCLHQDVQDAEVYLNKCCDKFSPLPTADTTSSSIRRKRPRVGLMKFFEFVATLRRSTVDVLLLSPEGAKFVTRRKPNTPRDQERLLVALFSDDEGQTMWPLEFSARRMPSLPPNNDDVASPFSAMNQQEAEQCVDDDFPTPPLVEGPPGGANDTTAIPISSESPSKANAAALRHDVFGQQGFTDAVSSQPPTGRSVMISGRTVISEACTHHTSETLFADMRQMGEQNPNFILPDRPPLFPPDPTDKELEEREKQEEERQKREWEAAHPGEEMPGVVPQPYADMVYPTLNTGSVGFAGISAAGLKFKRNLANFVITVVAACVSFGLTITILVYMIDRFNPCCNDGAISDVSEWKDDQWDRPMCFWNQTLKADTLDATDAMLNRCQTDVCAKDGLVQDEAPYGFFWNTLLANGRLLVLVILGAALNILLSLFLNFFISRPMATGGTPRFWSAIWIMKILAWGGVTAFTFLVTLDMENDFFVLSCKNLSTHGSQLCNSLFIECDIRLVVRFDSHEQLRHMLYGLCGVNLIGCIGALIYPLPAEVDRLRVRPATADTGIFRKGEFSPDGINDQQVSSLHREIREQFRKPTTMRRVDRQNIGLGAFLHTSRNSARASARFAVDEAQPGEHGLQNGGAQGQLGGTQAHQNRLTLAETVDDSFNPGFSSSSASPKTTRLAPEVSKTIEEICHRVHTNSTDNRGTAGSADLVPSTSLRAAPSGVQKSYDSDAAYGQRYSVLSLPPSAEAPPTFDQPPVYTEEDPLPMQEDMRRMDQLVHSNPAQEKVIDDIVARVLRERQANVTALPKEMSVPPPPPGVEQQLQ